ncbi:MAG: pseudaminic acid biosynthesis protein PseG [Bacteroides sp.]|nr:pseudaminic acid biosynthesis protein PseG [Bacteroides sp.]
MIKQQIILRADAGKNIGYGHFIRSLALAGYLKDYFDCSFCTFNPSELSPTAYQLTEINKVCSYIPVEATDLDDYNKRFLELLSGKEIVVLDNYYFQTDYQAAIRAKNCKLVCIDDLHDRHMVADAILTPSPLTPSDFSLETYTKFLGGVKYSLLREPFFKTPQKTLTQHPPRKIVLAIGGADPYKLTQKLLSIILKIDSTLHICIIAGDTVEVETDNHPLVKIFRRLSGEEIAALFSWADLAILPTSTICMEAFACHLPVAAGWYVDNQKEVYHNGVKEGSYMPLGYLLDDSGRLYTSLEKVLSTPPLPPPVIDFEAGRNDIIKLFKFL